MLKRIDYSGLWTRMPSGLLALSLLLVAGLPASAAEPLELIPAEATAVVRISTPEATINEAGNFANAVQPGLGFMVQGQAPGLGAIISNPSLGGVDLAQDWYVAAFAVKNAPPSVVFLIPATDTAALQKAVGEDFTFATKDSWVAYSKDEAVMELVEGSIDGGAESVSLTIGERSQAILDGSSAAVWVNLASIAETYSQELDAADEQLDIMLQGLSAQVPSTPGVNMAAVMDAYAEIGHALIQAVRDSEAFTIGASVNKSEITIDELLVVKARTPTDEFLTTQEPSELKVLDRLPQNQHGYVGVHGEISGLAEWGVGLAKNVMGEEAEETKEKLDSMLATLKEIEFGDMGWAFSLEDSQTETGLIEAFSVTFAEPVSKLREVALQMGDSYQFDFQGLTQTAKVEKDAQQYGEHSADVVTIKQEFDTENNPAAEMQNKLQEVLHGKDGMVQRLMVLDEAMIQTVNGDQETMKKALAAFKQPESNTTTTPSDNQVVRGEMLKEANLIGMIDLPNVALAGVKAAASAGALPVPIKAEQLEGLAIPHSFIGFSAGTEPQGLRMKTHIPAKTLNGFFQLFTFFQQAMQQQRQNLQPDGNL